MENAALVDWVSGIADSMRGGFSSRRATLEQCRRYGYQLWNKGGGVSAGSSNVKLVPQQDSFPAQCAWRGAMYLHANTIGLGQKFFCFDVDEETRSVFGKESSEVRGVKSVTLPFMRSLGSTNLAMALLSAFTDMFVLGTGIVYSEFNTKLKRLEFHTFQVSDDCLLSSNSAGTPDQFAQRFRLTAKQAAERWPGKVSDRVSEQCSSENTISEESDYLWLVYPRACYNHPVETVSEACPVVASDKKPWGSVVVDLTNRHVVSVSGYDAFPFAVCRWGVSGSSVYGWSPVEMSLPDIKYLAKLKFQLGEAIEKQVSPPMIIPYSWDGFDRGAGAYNYVEATGSIRDAFGVVDPPAQLPDIRDQQERSMMNIRANFLLDAFETFDEMTKTMSATEARGRVGQSVRAIAPVALNVHNDLLSPLFQRCLDLLIEHKALGVELPAAIRRNRVCVKYVSVLWAMVLDAETNKIAEFFARVLEFQQARNAFGPLFDAYFDLDAVFAHLGDFYSLPEDIIRSASARARETERIKAEAKAAIEQDEQTALLSKMNPQERSAPGSFAERRGF